VKAYLYVALGGSLGAVLRYALAGWVQQLAGGLFPWGTLFVNVVGSFLIGWFYETALRTLVAPELRLFFAVGVLGAFTTFSTFSYEILGLLREGAFGLGLLYAVWLAGFGWALTHVATATLYGALSGLLLASLPGPGSPLGPWGLFIGLALAALGWPRPGASAPRP
jgi:CrcB protein